MKTYNVYLGNGLFTEADRMYNDIIYDQLVELGLNVYAPQKNLAINDKTKSASSLPIYEGDTERLKNTDILVAVIDGQTIDEGLASEIGWIAGWNENYSFAEAEANRYGDPAPAKKIILGLYTDNRDASLTSSEEKNIDMVRCGFAESQYPYKNLYTIGCIKKWGKLFHSRSALMAYIRDELLKEEEN